MPKLILASTSPYRRALLERLGLPFRCVPPSFDEESIPRDRIDPRVLTETLARGKAFSVASGERDAAVIGSDQVVSLGGRILGKPGTIERAEAQLDAMAGKVHELYTSVAVIKGESAFVHTDVTRMHMRELSPEEIARYLAHDRPFDCAGSYKIEERGIVLFEAIESRDQTAITGLPLIALSRILRNLGFPIP